MWRRKHRQLVIFVLSKHWFDGAKLFLTDLVYFSYLPLQLIRFLGQLTSAAQHLLRIHSRLLSEACFPLTLIDVSSSNPKITKAEYYYYL